jgi:protoporphyrinogen/coproporphyrinogen III oxidase
VTGRVGRSPRVDLAVVGAGISGLAAAWEALQRGQDVVVLEADDRPGGKLRRSPVAGTGIALDEGADSFLARRPEAVELCRELGLGVGLTAPATGTAYVWSEGGLRRLPREQLLGVPTDLDAAAASGILSPAGVERARADLGAPDDRPAGDESIGALVRRRLGDEVLDRLVAPLVGGIWAGDCDRLSLQVAAAGLAAARDRDPSLMRGAAAVRAEVAGSTEAGGNTAGGDAADRPVFLAPSGGVTQIVEALADRLEDRMRCRAPVTTLEPHGGRWNVAIGPAAVPAGQGGPGSRGSRLVADRVVLATPAYVTAPLLAGLAPPVADFLGAIEHTSVVLTVMVVPRGGVDHPLDGSGFLVPQSAGRLLTACSWMTSKWAHLGAAVPDTVILRASAGRAGDQRALGLTDDELVTGLRADLRDTMGLHAEPTAVRITRWRRSFPQPRPGHLAALEAADTALAERAPGLAITGAWASGVGIPACIHSARLAVAAVSGDASPVP